MQKITNMKITFKRTLALFLAVLLTAGAVSVMGMDTGGYQYNDSNIYITTETETRDDNADADYGNDNEIDSDYGDTDYEDEDYYYTDGYDEDEEDDKYGLYGLLTPLIPIMQLDSITIDENTILPITIISGETAEIGGDVTGNIIVDGGTLIFDENWTITGTVTVQNGGTFVMSDGMITGAGTRGVMVTGTGSMFEMLGGLIQGNSTPHSGGGVIVLNAGTFIMPQNTTGRIIGNTAMYMGGGIFFDNASDYSAMHGGEIAHNSSNTNGGGGVLLTGSSTFTLYDGVIRHNTSEISGAGVNINHPSSSFVMYGGEIYDNHHIGTGTGGGGVRLYRGSFVMHDGIIRGNTTTASGGGVAVTDNFIMLGGTIESNTARQNGGGVFVRDTGSTFTMYGGTIDNNETTTLGSSMGGGVAVRDGATATMYDGLITRNESARHGGGVAVLGSSIFNMNGGTIYYNTATNGGGGAHVQGNANFIMRNDATVDNNFAGVSGSSGGGFYITGSGALTIYNGVVSNNISAGTGGGMTFIGSSTLTMHDGRVYNNEATSHGGGIQLYGASVTGTLNGGRVYSNESLGGHGGGVRVNQSATLTMTGGTIEGNTAALNGGGVLIENGSSFVMTGGTIEDNTATQNGGGVAVQSGANFTMSGTALIYDNTATQNGGGVFVTGANSEFTMTGGTIEDNTANHHGGGAAVQNGANFTMSGTALVYENTAVYSSGGVHVIFDAIFTMYGGYISNNRALATVGAGGAGGVRVANTSRFYMYGGEIVNNEAFTHGGGVRAGQGSTFTMIDGLIAQNESINGNGGGVAIDTTYALNAPITRFYMHGGTIRDNTATGTEAGTGGFGGGVRLGVTSPFVMTGGVIENNEGRLGGGVNVEGGQEGANFTMRKPESGEHGYGNPLHQPPLINNNTANQLGGGIHFQNLLATFTATAGTITNNTATEYGGGIWTINYANLNISDTVTFSGNTANAPHDYGVVNRGVLGNVLAADSGGGQGGNPQNIDWASVSIPNTHALNNFDINYTGSPLMLAVTFLPGTTATVENMPSNRTVEHGAIVSSTGAVTIPYRTGYTFLGWLQTIPAVAGNISSANVGGIVVTQDMTFVAQWQLISDNGGNDNGGNDNGGNDNGGNDNGSGNNGGGNNGNDGGTPTPPPLRKDPDSRYVNIGDYINWNLKNISNYTGATVTNFSIIDMPSRGLNFVSGNLPAFTNGAGITFDIRYTVAGSNEWRTYATGVDASQPFSFSLPQPGNIHYTNIGFFFGTVPADFALDNEIVLTFLVTDESPTNVLINRFALRYRNVERQGQGEVIIQRPDETPITGGGNNGGNNSGSATDITTLTPPAPAPPWDLEQPHVEQPTADSEYQTIHEEETPVVYGYIEESTTDITTDTTGTTDTTDTSTGRTNPQTSDNFSPTGIIVSMFGIIASLGVILLVLKPKRKNAA